MNWKNDQHKNNHEKHQTHPRPSRKMTTIKPIEMSKPANTAKKETHHHDDKGMKNIRSINVFKILKGMKTITTIKTNDSTITNRRTMNTTIKAYENHQRPSKTTKGEK